MHSDRKIPRVTREEARAWAERWRLVNEAEMEELRNTPIETKVRQLAVLMASVDEMGWKDALRQEDEQVRQRWIRLRQVLRA